MEPNIAALFRDQHGVASRRQLLEADWSETQVRNRVRKGELVRIHSGIYRSVYAPESWRGNVVAATLSTKGVASHLTAARLHRLSEVRRAAAVDVTVRHGRWGARPGVVIHQSTQVDTRLDVGRYGAIPVTGLDRTILDIGAIVGVDRMGAVIDAAVRQKQTSLARLWDVWARHARRGRNGCGILREALEARSASHTIPLSEWSRMVARLLASAGLPEPRLEFPVHDEVGRFVAQVDLAYPTARLAIELDSLGFHLNAESFVRARRRFRALSLAGWQVLPFSWEDYKHRPDDLVAQVRSLLDAV
jgi:very-short-patch-repair endonuclease